MTPEIEAELKAIGAVDDAEINLADAALVLAWADNPTVNIQRYREHLGKIETTMAEEAETTIFDGPASDILHRQIDLVNRVLFHKFGYCPSDKREFRNIAESNLFRTIERRKGLPILLGILYIHAARSQEWSITGLTFPSHFLMRMDYQGQRQIIDVFDNGSFVDASDMRRLAKDIMGPNAELDHRYYEPMSNRGILVRAVNHIKFHLIEEEHFEKALWWVNVLKIIAPDEPRLYFDSGVLYTRLAEYEKAITDLNQFIDSSDDAHSRHEAEFLLLSIKDMIGK